MDKIGITERGDAGLDLSWTDKMDSVRMAIFITKSVNDNFIKEVLNYKDKVILHATITGYGATILEPMVHDYLWSYGQVLKLIDAGFPKSQIVLRLDPVIPTLKGVVIAQKVLNIFSDVGIDRVRYSFCDMYPHVQDRFFKVGLKIPYQNLPDINMLNNFYNMIVDHFYDFESCAESDFNRAPCISRKDIALLPSMNDVILMGNLGQRKLCGCPTNKTELLTNKTRCGHKCLYCYWVD